MEKIRFSNNYIKLQNQTTAVLTRVEDLELNKRTREQLKEFLQRDTAMVGGGNYELRNGKYVILYFLGDRNIEFTTIRYAKPYYYGKLFDRKKWALERIGKVFKIEIKSSAYL